MSRHLAVDLGELHLRPLPKEMFDVVLCTNCQKNSARWEFAEGANPAKTFSCSICFLYEVPQIKEQRKNVDRLIYEVEQKSSRVFQRDGEFRLSTPDDADRVAFGVVMAQRFQQARATRGGFS